MDGIKSRRPTTKFKKIRRVTGLRILFFSHLILGLLLQLPHRHLSATEFWKMVMDTLKQAEDQLYFLQKKFDTVLPSPVVQV